MCALATHAWGNLNIPLDLHPLYIIPYRLTPHPMSMNYAKEINGCQKPVQEKEEKKKTRTYIKKPVFVHNGKRINYIIINSNLIK